MALMGMMQILKVCGIVTVEQSLKYLENKVDALFNYYSSKSVRDTKLKHKIQAVKLGQLLYKCMVN